MTDQKPGPTAANQPNAPTAIAGHHDLIAPRVLTRTQAAGVVARLDLPPKRRRLVGELVSLLGPDGRVSWDVIQEELFADLDSVASKARALDRRIAFINEATAERGIRATAVLTPTTRTEPTRWFQVEGIVEPEPGVALSGDLDVTGVRADLTAVVVDLAAADVSAPAATPAGSGVAVAPNLTPAGPGVAVADRAPGQPSVAPPLAPPVGSGFVEFRPLGRGESVPQEAKLEDAWRVAVELPGGVIEQDACEDSLAKTTEALRTSATRRPDRPDQAVKPDQPDRPDEAERVRIVADLLAWAEDDRRRPYMALLGEYGTGKTVTCQLFTKQQRRAREAGRATRWPLYFDLRKLQVPDPLRAPTVDEVMVECARSGWRDSGGVSADDLWRWLGQGAIAIFDGLDEVKLSSTAGAVLIERLLSVADRVAPLGGDATDGAAGVGGADQGGAAGAAVGNRAAGVGGAKRRPKVLISSRREFFRSLQDQRNRLTGHERGSVTADAYEARLLVPLTPDQIRDYLARAVGDRPIDQVMDMIEKVHDLTDLTRRPYTLRLVAEAVPRIEAWLKEGRPVYAARLYSEFTSRWLDRDGPKHLLRLHHKVALVQHLAVELWRTGRPAVPVAELEDWLHRWGPATQPDWESSYSDQMRVYGPHWLNRLDEDLRDSTFLIRQDTDDPRQGAFRFAHTSLQEFFLSEYLLQALRDDDPSRWERVARRSSATGPGDGASPRGQLRSDRGQIPADVGGSESRGELAIPSRETLAFLGQSLAELQEDNSVLVERMSWWFTGTNGAVDRVIVDYRRVARDEGWPATVGLVRSPQELRRFDRGTPQAVVAKIKAGEIVVGDRVALGGYVWRVLDAEKGLVLAEYPVDFRAFDEDWRGVSWAECSLREWLNGEFLASLLSPAERRALIAETVVHTPDNPRYGTLGGPDVRDRLYLLSREEVEQYLPDPNQRQPDSSSHKPRRSNGNLLERPHRRSARVSSSSKPRRLDRDSWAWWWLRSPGGTQYDACAVSPAGSVDGVGGRNVGIPLLGVRPAFRLNLESGLS